MPQPDNRRERGAATRATGPGQVAPSGLTMPGGSVSTSSGQAAANINGQVQIGQQGQIKDAGTGLYLALSGLFSGVGEGIKAYEKVYELQSESDYADFDTAYTQEAERVHQDPKKMKVWLDNQSYTPNRITAKKYNTLAAQVNEKDYVSYQNDEYIEFQKSIIGHTPDEQLKRTAYMMEMVEEDSPLWNKLREDSLTLESTVSEIARATTLSQFEQEITIGNQELKRQLRESSGGTLDYILDTEVFKLMLQANALLGDEEFSIDTTNQTITFNERSWPLSEINEGIAVELQAELMETLGPILEADLGRAGAVIKASGVSEPRRPGRTPAEQASFGNQNTALEFVTRMLDGAVDPTSLATALVEQSSPDETGDALVSSNTSLSNILKSLDILAKDDHAKRGAVLDTLGQLFDPESYSVVLEKLGYMGVDGELNASGEAQRKNINDRHTAEMFNVISVGLGNTQTLIDSSLNVNEAKIFNTENQEEMMLSLASMSGKSRVTYLEAVDPSNPFGPTQSLIADDPSTIPDGAFITGVEVFRDDANVTFRWDENSGVVINGGANNPTTKNLKRELAAYEAKNRASFDSLRNRQRWIESHGTQGNTKQAVESILTSGNPNSLNTLVGIASLPSRRNDIFNGVDATKLAPITDFVRAKATETPPTQTATDKQETFDKKRLANYLERKRYLDVFRGSPSLTSLAVAGFSQPEYKDNFKDMISTGASWPAVLVEGDVADTSEIHTELQKRLATFTEPTTESTKNYPGVERAIVYVYSKLQGDGQWDNNMTDAEVKARVGEIRESDPTRLDEVVAQISRLSSMKLISEQQQAQIQGGTNLSTQRTADMVIDSFLFDPESFIPQSTLPWFDLTQLDSTTSNVFGAPPEMAASMHVISKVIENLGPTEWNATQAVLSGTVEESEGTLEKLWDGFVGFGSYVLGMAVPAAPDTSFVKDNAAEIQIMDKVFNSTYGGTVADRYKELGETDKRKLHLILGAMKEHIKIKYNNRTHNEDDAGTIKNGADYTIIFRGERYPGFNLIEEAKEEEEPGERQNITQPSQTGGNPTPSPYG